MKFEKYLSSASRVLSYKKLTNAQALDALKKIYGIQIEVREVTKEEYPTMDREYFSEENVRQDLDAYCAKAGLTDVSELSTSNKFRRLEVICSNGETVRFEKYLRKASGVLSDKKLTLANALKSLKKIYGLGFLFGKIIIYDFFRTFIMAMNACFNSYSCFRVLFLVIFYLVVVLFDKCCKNC
ncbi:MAG: hypothetical protein RBS56_02305 [Candidatus Gracilibacteria bacterium]|nr:hypothetical protein [Candidatus Gracilibacteria bacterium]